MHPVNLSVSSVDRQDQPSRWGSIFSGVVSVARKTAGVVSRVCHALPRTGPAKPPGLPKSVIKQIKKAQIDAEKQSATHEERRVAAIEAAEKGKEISQKRESKKQRKARLEKERAHPPQPKAVEPAPKGGVDPTTEPGSNVRSHLHQPEAVETDPKGGVGPSTEPRSLRSYLTTAATVALVATAVCFAGPPLLAAAGLTGANTAVLAGTTSTAVALYSPPVVTSTFGTAVALYLAPVVTETLSSALITSVGPSLLPAAVQAGGSILALGGAVMANRNPVTVNMNNLDLLANEIGIPRRDLFQAAALFRGIEVDPTILSALDEIPVSGGHSQLPQIQDGGTGLELQTVSQTVKPSSIEIFQK